MSVEPFGPGPTIIANGRVKSEGESPIGTSPTPETDGLAERCAVNSDGSGYWTTEDARAFLELARKLERERDEAREHMTHLSDMHDDALEERDRERQRAERAEAALAEEKERQFIPPERGKMYCHPDDVPMWEARERAESENDLLREVIQECIEGMSSEYMPCPSCGIGHLPAQEHNPHHPDCGLLRFLPGATILPISARPGEE